MNFGIYIFGFLLLLTGLAYGAHLMGLSATWIAIGGVVLLGGGIMAAVKSTDPGQEQSGGAS